jgi:alpha-galactosidase
MNRINRRRWLGSVGSALIAGKCIPAGAGMNPGPQTEMPGPLPPLSKVQVVENREGPVLLRTSAAEFEILQSGYIRACLLRGGERVSLDDVETAPSAAEPEVIIGGKTIRSSDFVPDRVRVGEARGKSGTRGKRIEMVAQTRLAPRVERTLILEVYDDFPSALEVESCYRNLGSEALRFEKVVTARRCLNASLADAKVAPYRLYSFHGSSGEWGKEDVVEISRDFSRENTMGTPTPRGQGGGVPVVAFWTARAGEAIGHIETLPVECSFPVRTGADGLVQVSMQMNPAVALKPGETFSTPRVFIAVFAGDFYKPLNLYSRMLQREGWSLPTPSPEAYQSSWCGWGYEFDVTPADMLGTRPKLKEFGIRWATLDDRWFECYGDWEPRADTFPGDAIRKMADEFHRDGINVQIWWRALAAEDGQGRYGRFQHKLSKVVAEHPEWLILNKEGAHARLSRSLAVLCPALPEVQEYHRATALKFISDWGFDGHKLDNAFTVPPCYNPRHNHKSPGDSIASVGEVYRAIFEITRKLKPRSVTQICSCGTPPNYAWLPYLDQAVTADPVGSRQVRLRIKMLKALLGPEAAVYGDHVELTEIRFRGDEELDLGQDFASTIGAGGVVGTKFVWPDPGKFKEAVLTPDKEAHWKRWIGIYNSRMLSRGMFLDLYTFGYDIPEAYAIAKDGKMYYAFFTPGSGEKWTGTIELRGLGPGRHHVTDYVNKKDYGSVQGPVGRTHVEFEDHLLLEAVRI